MRKVTSISLDPGYLTTLTETIKKRGFKSLSEYFIHAVKIEQNLISEDELVEHIKSARKEYKKKNTHT